MASRLPDLSSYFGPRNKTRFTPKLNTNYTPEALQSMPTRKEADDIASHILALYDQPFSLTIYPAGLGGLAFPLAESSRVEKIFLVEPDYNLRQMLANNIKAYNLASKVSFVENYNQEEASLLLLDLIQNPSLAIGNILNEKSYPAYAFRVVSRYSIPKSPDYDCQLQKTSNPKTNLLLCTSIMQQLEELTIEEEWLNNLVVFLEKLLERIIPSPEERQEYFSENLLGYWVQAFTHRTIDPNTNYEVLEMLGDRLMKVAFADFLIQRIPKITESILTELQNYYLTTIPQSKLARDLGFKDYIRIAGEVNPKVLEDVLEAFFGALFRVSEEVAGGRGYYNVFMMVTSLYQDEPLEKKLETVKSGRNKTILIQMLAKLGLEKPIENFYEEENIQHFTLTIDKATREFFESRGIILPSVIGSGVGSSRKAAETNAYSEALSLFQEKGVTQEWVENTQLILMFDKPEYQPYLGTVRQRLAKEGFTKMTFSSPSSTSTTQKCITQLIGIRPNGSQEILATAESCNRRQGRVEVLRKYARM